MTGGAIKGTESIAGIITLISLVVGIFLFLLIDTL